MTEKLIGKKLSRVEGRLKVTGKARYAAEYSPKNLAYGTLIQSTIARGTIENIDDSAARSLPGVIAVITHKNAMPLRGEKAHELDNKMLALQEDRIYHDRQNIGIIVAENLETAQYAASLVKVKYKSEPWVTSLKQVSAGWKTPEDLGGGHSSSTSNRGDFESAFNGAALKIDQVYTTPRETHNPMEPHACTVEWSGDSVTVYDATQGVFAGRAKIAHLFDMPVQKVRVVCKFTGGGFGCKGTLWSHVPITIMASKMTGRPLTVSLQRDQMFGSVGFRPETSQHLKLGADADGKLLAMEHAGRNEVAKYDYFVESTYLVSRFLYACDNVRTSHHLVELDIGKPTFMRAPGETPGTFALESAMDELAYAATIDPVKLRLINYSNENQDSKQPYSSKSLKECYEQGASLFKWNQRALKPGSTRDGDYLVGVGMATATYPAYRSEAHAKATLLADGTALVQSGSADLGTGTYTVMAQVSADALGLPFEKVQFDLGDTDMPRAPMCGGSVTVASVGPAVKLACDKVIERLSNLATKDGSSPLHGQEKVLAQDGKLVAASDTSLSESFASILRRNNLDKLDAEAVNDYQSGGKYSMHSFGCHFAEVRVHSTLRTAHVSRWVAVFDTGTILNEKTATSQMYGGITMGIGMAFMEETLIDPRYGRTMNANLAEYHVPVHADIPPEFSISFVQKPDYHCNPLGAHGIGEIGITGTAAAIANAVYHATGIRIRELPITLDKLMV